MDFGGGNCGYVTLWCGVVDVGLPGRDPENPNFGVSYLRVRAIMIRNGVLTGRGLETRDCGNPFTNNADAGAVKAVARRRFE